MREHRVRRVLVCEEGGRVIGIVAQADLARHLDHAQSGAVVQGLSG
jgi:CBS domain-containing protein